MQGSNTGKGKRFNDETKRHIIEIVRKEEKANGYVDYITISSSILFSGKYVLCLEELAKQTLYNNIRQSDYPLADDYLAGLIVESCDYRDLFERYKDTPGVVFLVDPPYLNTDVCSYSMCWRLTDYLSVLELLAGHEFVYFTSDKSSIEELCRWLGLNGFRNPFENCRRVTVNTTLNHTSAYTDIMLYTAK